MSLRLVQAAAELENADDFHLGRLLLLLLAVNNRNNKTVEGITKLAKLDFLLRYPNCLERALKATNKDPSTARVLEHERTTIEAKMIRFRYGPWDERYRRWIGLLVARGLVNTFVKGKTVHVGLTELGCQVANRFADKSEFSDLHLRSELLIQAVGNYSATKIKNFIYEVFPEIVSLQWGEKIHL